MKADLLWQRESTNPLQELLPLDLEMRGVPEVVNFTSRYGTPWNSEYPVVGV